MTRGEVLVVDSGNGQNRSSLAAVRALHADGWTVSVTRTATASLATASRWCARVVPLPEPPDARFSAGVTAQLRDRRIAAVLPATDAAVTALGGAAAELVDKVSLGARVVAAGLRTPDGGLATTSAELRSLAKAIGLPVVVKPVTKLHAGEVARRIDTCEQLDACPLTTPVLVQPWLDGNLRAVAGVIRAGRLVAAVHQRYLRTWPTPCGVASAAVTTEPDGALEERLPALLAGHEGIFQVQLAGDTVLDVNPRAYGSLPLAVRAGVNLPSLAVDAGSARRPTHGRAGVHYRWEEGDLRWLWQMARTGRLSGRRALEVLRPHRKTAHSLLDPRDPRPSLTRLRHAVSR